VKRILLIDDDSSMRFLLKSLLEKAGYEVQEAKDGRAGVELFGEKPAQIVIVDIFMPEKDGIETIGCIREKDPSCKFLAISGGGQMKNMDMLRYSKILGAHEILEKPFSRDELLSVVKRLSQ
jgi:DNA-binding NtrC family response regulator